MTSRLNLRIKKLRPDVDVPHFQHAYDAGLDLRAAEDVTLQPGEKAVIPTGLAMAIPEGYAGLIWDRSGLAAKHALHCMAGVIDAGYRGEIGVVMINLNNEPYHIKKTERVAQIIIQPVLNIETEEVEELDETSRGEGGFGSTGKH